jgi:preprotein translocase subunit SecD
MIRHAFPIWKYVLLVLVIVLSTLYALPNIYGDEPAVQVSGMNGKTVDEKTVEQIKTILAQAHLTYRSIEVGKENLVLLRFDDTENQIKSKSYLKAGLGEEVTVALNLAPRTPAWLRSIGGAPMKLGLDLRGGVHFLLAVDLNSVIQARMSANLTSMWMALQKDNIRYAGVNQNDQGIVLRFREDSARQQALSSLEKEFGDFFEFKTVDESGQLQLIGTLRPNQLTQMRQSVMEQTMTVLRNRVNELGVAEPSIQQQGLDRISVDLPGIQDAVLAKQILGGTATLEFHLVDEGHDVATALSGQLPIGSAIYYRKDRQPVLLQSRVILKGSAITSASTSFGQDGKSSVNITASGDGVSYFNEVTGENVGHLMGIVYVETKNTDKLVDGKIQNQAQKIETVINVAQIQSALGNSFQVTGLDSANEAKNLAMLLRAGALPANIYPVAESIVGPSLGKDNIRKGIISVEVGFLLIVIFMIIYYRLFGLIANFALALNLIITIAVMSLIGATLTLPGIAALVLTVGMSVDANVLINERIREELRNGMSPLAAISAGYDRAFVTIVDANVTTLIVAVVLFVLGTGSVQGFSIALIIGLLTSMFTAVTATRAIVSLVYRGNQRIERLSIGI